MDIVPAIERGIQFLRDQQLPSGQFPIDLTRPAYEGEGYITIPDESPFATSHIVYSLTFLPDEMVKDMTTRALTYFQNEMSGPGLWNYWNKTAMWGKMRMYCFAPADADDTSNISFLMTRLGQCFLKNREILLLNRDSRGLFYTWVMLRPRWTFNLLYWRTVFLEVKPARFALFFSKTPARYRDVDAVVNANILFYLGECAETQPVIQWLIDIVNNRDEANCDKWYHDSFSFYYALSRNYYAGVQALQQVKQNIVTRLGEAADKQGQIGDHILHTALAANVLMNFEVSGRLLTEAISFLLESQKEDGSWESQTYYYGGPYMRFKWGSAALTTSLCLEALQRCQADGSAHQSVAI